MSLCRCRSKSLHVLIRSASGEPVALSARSRSPAERWHQPYSCARAAIRDALRSRAVLQGTSNA